MEHSSVILAGDFVHTGELPSPEWIAQHPPMMCVDYHGHHDPSVLQNIFHTDDLSCHTQTSKFHGHSDNLHSTDTRSYSNHTEARDNDIYKYNVHSETGPDGHKSNFELTLHGKAQDHTLECHDTKVVEEKDIGCTTTSKTR